MTNFFFWGGVLSPVSLLLQAWAAVWQTRLDCGPVRERGAICDRLLRRRSGVESHHLRRPPSVWLCRSRVGSHEGGVVEMDLVMNLCCFRRFIFIHTDWGLFGLVYPTLTGSAVFMKVSLHCTSTQLSKSCILLMMMMGCKYQTCKQVISWNLVKCTFMEQFNKVAICKNYIV